MQCCEELCVSETIWFVACYDLNVGHREHVAFCRHRRVRLGDVPERRHVSRQDPGLRVFVCTRLRQQGSQPCALSARSALASFLSGVKEVKGLAVKLLQIIENV